MKALVATLFTLPCLGAWPLLWVVTRAVCARRNVVLDWRLRWIITSVSYGAILTAIVELSSAFHTLNRLTLLSLWVCVDLVLVGVWLWERRLAGIQAASQVNSPTTNAGSPWPMEVKILLGASALTASILFLIALFTPTTNGDSLSYHLARMAHWIQQQSVDHFPTDDTRQLEFGPWSSFVMTNLFLLWGNDRLLNLVQWFALVSTVIVLTWIAEQLLALTGKEINDPLRKKRVASLTCVLAVTLPIGVVESISTQNDYTTAFWLVGLFAFAFCVFKNPSNQWFIAGAGTACGLGVLTKATTYIYAAPLVLAGGAWWLWTGMRKSVGSEAPLVQSKSRMRLIPFFVAPFLALNASHMMRNYSLFHSPLGSTEILSLERNGKVTVAIAASNAIRNLALHANSGIPAVSHCLNRILATAHGVLGIDLNDASSTYENCPFQFQERFFVFDSAASCTFHVFLITCALAWLAARFRRSRALLVYSGLLLGGAALFCALLKWQPWHSRLHLAWLLLLVPVAAIILSELPKAVGSAAAVIALTVAGTTIVYNSSRPVLDANFRKLPREAQYLTLHDHDLTEPLRELANKLASSDCRAVGLKADFCGIEYPLWVMLQNRGFHGQFFRCYVTHASAQLQQQAADPCVIVTVFNRMPEAVTRAYPYSETYGRLFALWPNDPADHRVARETRH